MSIRRRGNGFEAARIEAGRRVRRLWPSRTEALAWERSGGRIRLALPTLKEILTVAQQAFSFAKPSDQDWIFGKTALELYSNLKN